MAAAAEIAPAAAARDQRAAAWRRSATAVRAATILAGLPPEDRECIEECLQPWLRGHLRKAQFRVAFITAGAFYPAPSPWKTAGALRKALARYAAAAWEFERGRPPPADPRRGALHRCLTLTDGWVPSCKSIHRWLALESETTFGGGFVSKSS